MGAAGRRGFIGLVILAMVAGVTGCGSEGGSSPISAAGTIAYPGRPLIVEPIPDGWSVLSSEPRGYLPRELHTLYLPPGSTPEQGPALAVGVVGPEDGYTLCGRGRETDVRLTDATSVTARLVRSGDLVALHGETANEAQGYVFGRGLTDEQILAAGRAARFGPGTAQVLPDGLPSGFRTIAAAPVPPNWPFGSVIELSNVDGTQSVHLGAYDGNAATDLLTQFWDATVVKAPCANTARASITVGGTNVLVTGRAPRAVVDRVAANITVTDQQGLDQFRDRTAELPASALLSGCGSDTVIVEGTTNDVRWVIGMPGSTLGLGISCSAFVMNGQVVRGAIGTGGPAVVYPGTYEVTVLTSSSTGLTNGGALNVVGGTVPVAATRVVISDDAGLLTDATLVSGGPDPTRRYFGGLLTPSSIAGASMRITIVAYDEEGVVIGRYVPGPR